MKGELVDHHLMHLERTHVSAGGYHTCSLALDRRVTCWGRNDHGQASSPTGFFSQISAGLWHSCGIRFAPGTKEHNSVHCWGGNTFGQSTPPAKGQFSEVAAGGWHTCALKRTDNSILCWGSNEYGQVSAPTAVFAEVRCWTKAGGETIIVILRRIVVR